MSDASEEARATVTRCLAGGEAPRAADIFPLVYDELRRQAARYLSRERIGHTLEPTALVHEAYLRLVDDASIAFEGRSHFLAIAATVMRRVLVEHARRKGAAKRGGDWERVTISAVGDERHGTHLDLLALDDALTELAALDERKARVAETRLFGGLTYDETGVALGLTERQVEGDWTFARSWLKRRLKAE